MKQIIECVPNFSEGRDERIIQQIANEIQAIEGVRLLHVDAGKAANRTVITFAGTPAEVCEAAFQAIKKAAELIDMRKHKGEHPRIGATDVCPLVPIANISIEEVTEYARKLAQRVGEELNIPVYCYEYAATYEHRRNLAFHRKGEYEGLAEKLKSTEKPDFGSCEFNEKTARSGATVLGARNILIAYNVNLNTISSNLAHQIAQEVRESGKNGKEGKLKKTKAIGWFIEEYGVAQVSMNLTDFNTTAVHTAFDEVCSTALNFGLRVTGSELIGLIPLKALTDAGKYFLRKQKRSSGVSQEELIRIAVKSLGLEEYQKFNPKERIIEYLLEDESKSLLNNTLQESINQINPTNSLALIGSISASLTALSANELAVGENLKSFSEIAEKAQVLKHLLEKLIIKNSLVKNEDEVQIAIRNTVETAFQSMKLAYETLLLIQSITKNAKREILANLSIAIVSISSVIKGGFLLIKIDACSLKDKDFVESVIKESEIIENQTLTLEPTLLELIHQKI